MATLASIKLDLFINTSDIVKNIESVVENIGNISTVIERSKKSFETLNNAIDLVSDAENAYQNIAQNSAINNEDKIKAAENLEKTSESLVNFARVTATTAQNAKANLNNITQGLESISNINNIKLKLDASGVFIDTQKMTKGVNEVTQSVKNLIEKRAIDILDLAPTAENAQKVKKELIEIQNTVKKLGLENTLNDEMKKLADATNTVTAETLSAQRETNVFNSMIKELNEMPFLILYASINTIVATFKEWIPISDEVKAKIEKIAPILLAVVTLIGLASAQTFSWAATQSYLTTLWNSNIIVVGLKAIVGYLGTCVTLTATWSAIEKTILIVAIAAALATVVALIVSIIANFVTTKDRVEDTAKAQEILTQRVKDMNDSLDASLSYYEKQYNIIQRIKDQQKDTTDKVVQQRRELEEATAAYQKLSKEKVELSSKIGELEKAGADPKEITTLREKLNRLQTLIEKGRVSGEASYSLGPENIVKERDRINQQAVKTRDLDKYLDATTRDPAKIELERAIEQATKALLNSEITQNQFDKIMKQANKVYDENNQEVKKRIENEKKLNETLKSYTDAAKSPVEAFREQKKMLDAVNEKLTDNVFAFNSEKLNQDFAKNMGVDKYIKDPTTQKQDELKQTLQNIDTYFKEMKIVDNEIINAAKARAKEEFAEKKDEVKPLENKNATTTAAERGTAEYWKIILVPYPVQIYVLVLT